MGILVHSGNTTFTMTPALRSKPGFDPIQSDQSIGITGTVPLALVAHPAAPAASLKALIDLAKAAPGSCRWSFGSGTSSHFCATFGIWCRHRHGPRAATRAVRR